MKLQNLMSELEAAGTSQNRKIYARHGAHEPMFGVSFAMLNGLQKKIKKDHELACELWATGNYDSRILACKIADPVLLTREEADAWAADVSNYVQSGELAGLVLKTSFAKEKAQAWIEADGEYIERAGWLILSGLSEKSDLPDDFFLPYLEAIEHDIHISKNRVRDAMNTALITFGLRPALTDKALAGAERIGKVNVDHGQTGCVTPDAAGYIQKTLAYRARKAK